MTARLHAVLFDLDGTLIDSAPDLAGACNDLRAVHGMSPLPFDVLRPMVGAGARGMIGVGFGVSPGGERYESLRDAFLAGYQQRMTRETRVFDGVVQIVSTLEGRGLPWGIVTNKAARLAEPLIRWLDFAGGAGAIVCGDTTPHSKPHPEPLFEAARRLGVEPARCAYVGDDRRDIVAGKAAGMLTVAAAWGYLGAGEPIGEWDAHAIVATPREFLPWLDSRTVGT